MDRDGGNAQCEKNVALVTLTSQSRSNNVQKKKQIDNLQETNSPVRDVEEDLVLIERR